MNENTEATQTEPTAPEAAAETQDSLDTEEAADVSEPASGQDPVT